MKRHTIFLDSKNQYCQNDHRTQGNLQIQCNPYLITNGVIHRIKTKQNKILKFIWRHWRPQTAKAARRKKNRAGRNQTLWFQAILQSYSHQNNMVLAQKQKYGSMDKIKTPEINPWTYSQLIYNTRSKIIQWRKDSFFNGAGKTGQLHVKKWNIL